MVLLVTKSLLVLLAITSGLWTGFAIFLPDQNAVIPAIVLAIAWGSLSLLQFALGSPRRVNKQSSDATEVHSIEETDPKTRLAAEKRKSRTLASLIVKLVIISLILTATVLDEPIAAAGLLLAFFMMLLFGGGIWIASIQEEEEAELKERGYRTKSIP